MHTVSYVGLGQYGAVSLAEARKSARELRARIQLGFDPAMEKRERLADTHAKERARKLQRTVTGLTEEFLVRHVGALKIPPHICERCLNHKIGGVQGVYDRNDYFDERKVVPIGKGKSIG